MDSPQATHRSLHLLIALLLAAVLLFAARSASQRVFPAPVRAANTSVTTAAANPAAAEQNQEDAPALIEARQARQQREQTFAEAERLRREQKLQQALAAREQSAEIARLDQEHKEQAWQRFYKKPEKCRAANDPSAIVDCSNHYLREQQRFEKQWAEGKIAGR